MSRGSDTIADVLAHYEDLPEGESAFVVHVGGKVHELHQMGRLLFATIADATGSMTLFLSPDHLCDGNLAFNAVRHLRIGNSLYVEGTVARTALGEITVTVRTCVLATTA